MSRIHQFHFSVAPGDAITNQMFFIQRSLREVGIGGEIYAGDQKELPGGTIRKWDPRTVRGDLLLLHHSQGNPALSKILENPIPKALVYHNITPAKFYRHDPHIAKLCHEGREQLFSLRSSVRAAFTVSSYNALELTALGYSAARIIPLLDLSQRGTVPSIEEQVNRRGPGVFVGRLAPHKNQALLLKSLYYWKKSVREAPDFIFVGGGDPLYSHYLRLLTRALGLENNVRFTGRVSDDQLVRIYNEASFFVCASLHEGFCIPIAESMRQRLPIFAIPTTGVRETLGTAGLHIRTRRPHRIAAVLEKTVFDRDVRKAILLGQESRFEMLCRDQNKSRVQTIFQELLLPPDSHKDRRNSLSHAHSSRPPENFL